jgi:aminopeptidase N
VDVTAHEIGHTYFPFYVGTNERQRAWMDEGWADLFTTVYMETKKSWSKRLYRYVQQMNKLGGKNMTALPVMTPATSENGANYMFLSYFKPVLAYHFLHLYLGDKLYKKALQGYINRWKYKHPMPYDFFYSFNDLAGKNLDWFWNAWFFKINHADLSIEKVKKVKDGYQISIANKGGLPLPVKVKLIYDDGSTKTSKKSLGIWKDRTKPVEIHAKKNLKKVILGNKLIPDIHPDNNVYKIGG